MAKKIEYVKPVGFSEEEKRIRRRILDMGIRQRDIADELGISKQDVSMAISGKSTCPKYVSAVYDYLGLDMPKKDTDTQTSA